MNKIKKEFRKFKKLLNDEYDYKVCLDGFSFNSKAVEYLDNAKLNFHMNTYYDLTKYDVLNLINENESIEQVKAYLYNEYESYYADSWYQNFEYVLSSL